MASTRRKTARGKSADSGSTPDSSTIIEALFEEVEIMGKGKGKGEGNEKPKPKGKGKG